MARRLVSGAKEATAGLRIASKAYRKTGLGAAIKSQKEDGSRPSRRLPPHHRPCHGCESGFDIANHRPAGEMPTKTMGSLHGRGRSTVAWMCEFPPGTLAGKPPVITLAMPSGVRQLTVASKE